MAPDVARLYLGRCTPPNRRESNAKAARRALAMGRAARIVLRDNPTNWELLDIFNRYLAWARFWSWRFPHDDSWRRHAATYERLIGMATRLRRAGHA